LCRQGEHEAGSRRGSGSPRFLPGNDPPHLIEHLVDGRALAGFHLLDGFPERLQLLDSLGNLQQFLPHGNEFPEPTLIFPNVSLHASSPGDQPINPAVEGQDVQLAFRILAERRNIQVRLAAPLDQLAIRKCLAFLRSEPPDPAGVVVGIDE
jgi:hypothetical protein